MAGLVAGTMLSFAPVAYAAPSPSGILCGFSSATDPQVEGSQTGEVDAGPLFWTDDTDPTLVASSSGSITCTIQVNEGTHAGADACAVTGPETPVVGAAAGTCTYAAGPDDNVYLCTQATVNGQTLYYNSSNDPLVEGDWSTSNTASCALATSASTPGEDEEPWATLDPLLDTIFDLLNATVCPILHTLDNTLG